MAFCSSTDTALVAGGLVVCLTTGGAVVVGTTAGGAVVGSTVGSVVAVIVGSVVGSAAAIVVADTMAGGAVAAAFTPLAAAEPSAAITMTLMMSARTPSPSPMADLALFTILARAIALRMMATRPTSRPMTGTQESTRAAIPMPSDQSGSRLLAACGATGGTGP